MRKVISRQFNIAFSHDVMSVILVFQKKETAAMLVFQTDPVRVELFSYINTILFHQIGVDARHVSENALWEIVHWSKQKPTNHFKLRWFQQNKMRMTQMPRLFL